MDRSKDQLYLHPHAADAAVGEIAIQEPPRRRAQDIALGNLDESGMVESVQSLPANSSRFLSPIANDLNTLKSKLLVPPVSSVLRPTVEAFGISPTGAWTQRTWEGGTQPLVSGF
jgi:hypothetical protein